MFVICSGYRYFKTREILTQLTELDAEVNTNEHNQNGSMNNVDSQLVSLLEEQVSDLREQVDEEKAEKNKLLDLANSLQKQNELLMLPSSENKRNWFHRLIGK